MDDRRERKEYRDRVYFSLTDLIPICPFPTEIRYRSEIEPARPGDRKLNRNKRRVALVGFLGCLKLVTLVYSSERTWSLSGPILNPSVIPMMELLISAPGSVYILRGQESEGVRSDQGY